jgi:hypothetical protein
MTSMLETLLGDPVKRRDEKRILPTRRPLPERQRDLLELFMALGQQATMQSLLLSCDLREAEPRVITFVTLSRWPTADELGQQPTPYTPRIHLRSLLGSQEFRASLIRRICDAFPERPRLLYVRIPRCAGEHFLHMADTLHAIFPPDLGRFHPRDEARFIPALGAYLGRFNITKTIMLAQPSLAPFVQAPLATAGLPGAAAEGLQWTLNPPPRRPGDRVFTIVREPQSLILSQVNAVLTRLQGPPADDDPATAALRNRHRPLPALTNAAAWTALGQTILLSLAARNPICTALGDGTASGALQACRLSDVELADLSRYMDWVKFKWNLEPEPAINTSRSILPAADLTPAAQAHLAGLVDEDVKFHSRVMAELAKRDHFNPFVRGRDL